jgi:hypothetical protein
MRESCDSVMALPKHLGSCFAAYLLISGTCPSPLCPTKQDEDPSVHSMDLCIAGSVLLFCASVKTSFMES